MGEQSGCDPKAAVEARLRHLLVENPAVLVSPVTGAISIEAIATKTHREEDGTLVIDEAELVSIWHHRDPGDETTA